MLNPSSQVPCSPAWAPLLWPRALRPAARTSRWPKDFARLHKNIISDKWIANLPSAVVIFDIQSNNSMYYMLLCCFSLDCPCEGQEQSSNMNLKGTLVTLPFIINMALTIKPISLYLDHYTYSIIWLLRWYSSIKPLVWLTCVSLPQDKIKQRKIYKFNMA